MERFHSAFWKWATIGSLFLFAVILVIPSLPFLRGHSNMSLETKALNQVKQIGFACHQYAEGHSGNFPASLDALFPQYLPDRSILVSPLQPNDPAGMIYHPGLTEHSPDDTVLLEVKPSPRLPHIRIVAHVDDSAVSLTVP